MLSRETRWNILVLHYDRQFTPLEISKLIVTATHKVSERTVQRVIAQFEATGEVINHHITTTYKVTDTHIPHAQIAGSSARRPSNGHIDAEHRPLLYLIIEQDPWLYLDELVDRLNNHPMVLTRIYDLYGDIWRPFRLRLFELPPPLATKKIAIKKQIALCFFGGTWSRSGDCVAPKFPVCFFSSPRFF